MTYKLLANGGVFREEDKAMIMPDASEWKTYKKWLKEGNKPEAADPEPIPSVAERRAEEYEKQGCTQKALVIALWELVVENRPDAATALELVRERVKEDVAEKVTKGVSHAKR